MARFTIKVTQTDVGYITVEAPSRKDAKVVAASEWYEGKTEWVSGNTDLSIADVKEVPAVV